MTKIIFCEKKDSKSKNYTFSTNFIMPYTKLMPNFVSEATKPTISSILNS